MNSERPLTRILSLRYLSLLAVGFFSLLSCSEKETFHTDALTDYYPMASGKYVTYRLDSTVFTNFGRNVEVHKYQMKEVIDQLIDTMGYKRYRVYRYLRDTAGLQPWNPILGGTFDVNVYTDRIEVVDDNLRIVKLHLPIRDGFSWKGNTHLPFDPYGATYSFSNDDNMADWDFYFDGTPSSFTFAGHNYADVLSIEEDDENYNVPITDPAAYAARSRAVEKYSKSIGLIYREYEMWEYQPNPGGTSPYQTGFGIKMWMIDHN